MKINNEIYLRRGKKLIVSAGNESNNLQAASFSKNLCSLGFSFSSELFEVVKTLDNASMSGLYSQTIKHLKTMVGAHKKHVPMYKNFPEEVMNLSDAELYFNAICHYENPEFIPEQVEVIREKFSELTSLTKLKLGSSEDFCRMIRNLLSASTSISESDKADVKSVLLENLDCLELFVPEQIPFKENLCFAAGILFSAGVGIENLTKLFNNATDVLRFASALSGGDVSLAEKTKYKKFSRSERRMLLGLLESQKNLEEDMLRHDKKWIRLGERIHPGEFSVRFPKSFKAFSAIRNSEKIETFAGKVETGILAGKILETSKLLKTRPGEFARRMDKLLRESDNANSVVSDFSEIAGKLTTPMLLSLSSHFLCRNDMTERPVFPKGSLAKIQVIDVAEKKIPDDVCLKVSEICESALVNKFKAKESLGKVFVDSSLSKQVVPFSQRSASKALKTIVRGSRMPIGSENVVRLFLWWKNAESSRIDVDLSCAFFDESFNEQSTVSFRNVRNQYCVHSGDIVDAPNGASEFIDINIEKALEKGICYAAMDVRCYSGIPYVDLPECFAGFMMRDKEKSGEVYEPKSVHNKFDLTSNTISTCPIIFDLVNREMVWVDLSLQTGIEIGSSRGSFGKIAKAMCGMKKASLYQLFELHAKARGTIVDKREDADIVFSMDGDVTPFDIEKIVGEYLV